MRQIKIGNQWQQFGMKAHWGTSLDYAQCVNWIAPWRSPKGFRACGIERNASYLRDRTLGIAVL
jgi:hypothetical protein